jgi:hypothetical protein
MESNWTDLPVPELHFHTLCMYLLHLLIVIIRFGSRPNWFY